MAKSKKLSEKSKILILLIGELTLQGIFYFINGKFTALQGLGSIVMVILYFYVQYRIIKNARAGIKRGDYSWYNVTHAYLPINKRWVGVVLVIFVSLVTIPLSNYLVRNFVTNANLGLGIIMIGTIYPILLVIGYVAYHNRNNKNHVFYYAFHNKSYSLNSTRMYFIIMFAFLFFTPLIILLTGLFPSFGQFIANFPNSLWMDSPPPRSSEVMYP
jgi:hypothetical protein